MGNIEFINNDNNNVIKKNQCIFNNNGVINLFVKNEHINDNNVITENIKDNMIKEDTNNNPPKLNKKKSFLAIKNEDINS